MADEMENTQEEEAQEPEEESGQQAGPAPEMRAEDVIRFAVNLFAEIAWVNLGIRANPASGETKTDFAQARLAIDSIKALVPLTEGRIDPHEVRDLNNLVGSLQFNYVQKYTP
jgi:hypothetical protein